MSSVQMSNKSAFNSSPKLEFGYYAELAQAQSIADFRARINEVVRRLGFSEYTYLRLENTKTPQRLLNTLPEELIISYYKANFFEYDMNIQRSKNNTEPFFCSTVHDYIAKAPFTSNMTRCMNGIRELNHSFGFYDFYNIPIVSQGTKSQALLSITQRGMIPIDLQHTIADYKTTLHLLGDAINEVAVHKFPNDFSNITPYKLAHTTINPKPLQVLSTLANYDYNINEIANKLCISVVTVNQHLKTVRTCLGTKTNYAAIKQAIQANLIQFNTQPVTMNKANEH